jgi:hypothetical protein
VELSEQITEKERELWKELSRISHWSLLALLRALSFNPAGRSSIPLRIDRTYA